MAFSLEEFIGKTLDLLEKERDAEIAETKYGLLLKYLIIAHNTASQSTCYSAWTLEAGAIRV